MREPGRFASRTVVITGAGSGLGAALAHAFAAEGASVAVVDIDAERAATVASEAPGALAVPFQADVRDHSEVEAMADAVQDELGCPAVLVNNAAHSSDVELTELHEDDWDADVEGTLKTGFLCSRAFLPAMLRSGGGVICNIGSVNGLGYFGNDAYSAAKAGLVSLTRSVAVRYGAQGIRANMVAPGTLRTPAWARRLEHDPEVLDRLGRWYPLGRVGTPADVTGAVLFLCSDEASWITGAVLPVDGGILAGHRLMADDILGPASLQAAPTS
ncbi:MAG: SDR family NAD(P)-dependent oxidoreductase [Acidimicrobiales bacterium]